MKRLPSKTACPAYCPQAWLRHVESWARSGTLPSVGGGGPPAASRRAYLVNPTNAIDAETEKRKLCRLPPALWVSSCAF
jgi:hypothetical protein